MPFSTMTRRTVLAGAAGTALAAATGAGAAGQGKAFPKGFLWGVATAGHQIEGNETNSDYWVLENVKPTVFAERSGDACDSYHRYEEDIALLARLGFNTYRFSIQWSRIEPDRGSFSNAELDYYKRVIECCHRHGVKPAVTFFHGTAPIWFAAAGGWTNPDAPELFAGFCSTAAKALAEGMAFAFTINEPQVAKAVRFIPGAEAYADKQREAMAAMHAAAAKSVGSDRFSTMDDPDYDRMEPQLLAAHRQACVAIKAERGDLPTGVCLAIMDFEPGSKDSPYEDLRKNAYSAWLEAGAAAGDFIGVQTYHLIRIPGKGTPFPPLPPTPFAEPGDAIAGLQQPEALRNAVEYVYAQTKKPILVTENGIEADNDARRVWYIDGALAGLHEAIAKGVPVLGYTHWSLLDNFEWERGYKPKFGLIAVDRTTFKRTPKPSATHLGRIARANRI